MTNGNNEINAINVIINAAANFSTKLILLIISDKEVYEYICLYDNIRFSFTVSLFLDKSNKFGLFFFSLFVSTAIASC